MHTKVLIIGSGAAGYSAAIYAARANLQPIVITGMQPGGQLTITTDVENYPGFVSIQGPELMEQMRLHAEKVGAQIVNDEIKSVEQSGEHQFRSFGNFNNYDSNAIIIASGAQAKWLELESEKKFQGYGVSACATCDGAFFRNKVVAVIGGGNTAVEEAIFLTRFARKVILIHRRDTLRAEKVGAQIVNDEIKSVEQSGEHQFRSFGNFNNYDSNAIIIASGAQAKWLELESEKKFQGYGVSACATCDGAFFRNKVVAVIGGGNTAVEEAIFLTRFARKVILIHRRDTLRAEKVMQERLFKDDRIEIIWNHTVKEILGEENPKKVTDIVIQSTKTGDLQKIKIDGIFIAIGHVPNTGLFKGFIEMDEQGYIITKPGTTLTNRLGVFAAGDVQDKVYRQAVVAAGTGCMAALDAEKFLEEV